jgi:hypothetical protein
MHRYLTVGGTVNPNANPYTNTSKLGMDISNGVIYGYYNTATDASGISNYTINDTTRFNINNSGYLKSLYKYLIHTFEITNAMQDNLVVWLKEKEN